MLASQFTHLFALSFREPCQKVWLSIAARAEYTSQELRDIGETPRSSRFEVGFIELEKYVIECQLEAPLRLFSLQLRESLLQVLGPIGRRLGSSLRLLGFACASLGLLLRLLSFSSPRFRELFCSFGFPRPRPQQNLFALLLQLLSFRFSDFLSCRLPRDLDSLVRQAFW